MPSTKKLLQAAAGSAGGDKVYVEDVFSTYLYEGSSNPITINNGIDFAGEGGLFWVETRNPAGQSSALLDTERGTAQTLATQATSGNVAIYSSKNITYNNNGVTIPADSSTATGILNFSNYSLCNWSFRKAEKFFDIQTFSGSGGGGTQILNHNLGSVPSFILLKKTSATGNWWAIHKSVVSGSGTSSSWWLNTGVLESTSTFFQADLLTAEPTDSTISLGPTFSNPGNTGTYVAYLFASDAGGYGDAGDGNIIKCGGYTGNNGSQEIELGFEPQWIMIKNTSVAEDWCIFDTMRGFVVSPANVGDSTALSPNTTAAEAANTRIHPSATGFGFSSEPHPRANQNGNTYIYIAIRMPMKTPTDGTEVYISDDKLNGNPNFPSPFPVDFAFWRSTNGDGVKISSRLMGKRTSYNTTTQSIGDTNARFDYQDGWYGGNEPPPYQSWMFKRRPGFMDVVYLTTALSGTNVQTIKHNLGVAPELIIGKVNSTVDNWYSYSAAIGLDYALYFNTSAARAFYANGAWWGGVAPTNTQFTYSTFYPGNWTYRLFATLAGVSKVGTYTANANSTNIACGFSGTARFILIKRYDAVGDWYLWDSFRGISAAGSNDPYLLLNSSNAQVTNTDYIAPYAGGFNLTTNGSSTINVSGGSYIFLAIA